MTEQTISTYLTLLTMMKCLLDPTEMLGNIAIRELDIVLMRVGMGGTYRCQPTKAQDAPGLGTKGDFCISILKFNGL